MVLKKMMFGIVQMVLTGHKLVHLLDFREDTVILQLYLIIKCGLLEEVAEVLKMMYGVAQMVFLGHKLLLQRVLLQEEIILQLYLTTKYG